VGVTGGKDNGGGVRERYGKEILAWDSSSAGISAEGGRAGRVGKWDGEGIGEMVGFCEIGGGGACSWGGGGGGGSVSREGEVGVEVSAGDGGCDEGGGARARLFLEDSDSWRAGLWEHAGSGESPLDTDWGWADRSLLSWSDFVVVETPLFVTEESDDGIARVRLPVDDRFSLLLHDIFRAAFVPIDVLFEADLPEMNFCDPRLLQRCRVLVTNACCRVEESRIDKARPHGENIGLKTGGVSGNVWLVPEVGTVDILSLEVWRSARMPIRISSDNLFSTVTESHSRHLLPLPSARTMLSSRSGLEGELEKLELVGVDGWTAVSGKEGYWDVCWGPVTGNDEGSTDNMLASSGASTWLLAGELLAERVDARRSLTGRKVAGCRRNAFTEARDGRWLERESGRRRDSGVAPNIKLKRSGRSIYQNGEKSRTRPAPSREYGIGPIIAFARGQTCLR
jgi:hypothetical protein